MANEKNKSLTKQEIISYLNEGYLYILCSCGEKLMMWANLKETTHHVPLTDKCSKYKIKMKNILEVNVSPKSKVSE